ncbi:hypothetical protein FBR02_04600 [Anaerolineae bacterium CFX9]|nr:hypothetical protein [Anaerolineae bacterium CFX9]
MVPAYALEHFYHGQVLSGGRLQGDLHLLAQSPGVRPEHVFESMRLARVPALPGAIYGTWSLVRGETVPFIMVQTVMGNGGQPMRHFILLPVDVLRALGGNLQALRTLILGQFPFFSTTGHTLPLLGMPQISPPSAEAQEESMLALMTATRDRMEIIEALLAALIQGVPIIVQHAPEDIDQRIRFIEGILALLPAPARFGVTFTTFSTPQTQIDAQIRFYTEDPPPDGALIYNWKAAAITGRRVDDEYSRFIRSQLRLDTGLVIEQTRALTPVAGWRLRRGDSLADALHYASDRLKMDSAVINSQPVEAKAVARALIDDPTLTDELRAAYIRHLLAFALALDDVEEADLLTVVSRGNSDLERQIIEQMDNALAAGKGDRVYRRLFQWMQSANGFKGILWVEVLHRAVLANATALARAGDAEAMNNFLMELQSAPPEMEMMAVLPSIVELALPLSLTHRDLARSTFVLAAMTQSTERWQRVVSARPLLAQLPPAMTRFMTFLLGENKATPPPSLLAQALAEFAPDQQPPLIVRLTEICCTLGRYDLLDSAALHGLANAATTPWGDQFDALLKWIVRNLSTEDRLPVIEPEGRAALLKIMLARRAFNDLVNDLGRHSRLFYSGDKQMLFATLMRTLFAETPLPVQDIAEGLTTLSQRGSSPFPLAMAYFGALDQHQWAPELEAQAADLTALVTGNRLIAEALQPDQLLDLLNYHVARQDISTATRVALTIPFCTARRGESGISTMIQMYHLMDWEERLKTAALDSLRRFIRRLPDNTALAAIDRFGRDLGDPVREALEATHLLWRMMAGEGIGDYAYTLNSTARFLYDSALAYMDRNRTPTIAILINDLDSLSGGLNEEERAALVEEIVELGRLVYALATRHRQARPKETDDHINSQLSGKVSAVSILEVWRIMGGYFSRGRRFTVRTERAISEHPLGDRAAHLLVREVQQINRLLRAALRAAPAERKLNLSARAITLEVESLWEDISLHERRALVRDLAIDCQRIPELALLMTERADPKALEINSGLGKKLDTNKQRPENTLEFYRFVHGYFKARMR